MLHGQRGKDGSGLFAKWARTKHPTAATSIASSRMPLWTLQLSPIPQNPLLLAPSVQHFNNFQHCSVDMKRYGDGAVCFAFHSGRFPLVSAQPSHPFLLKFVILSTASHSISFFLCRVVLPVTAISFSFPHPQPSSPFLLKLLLLSTASRLPLFFSRFLSCLTRVVTFPCLSPTVASSSS